ncbi:hypothetical protein BDB00DRAFT_840174 [Zychaea mexicana]|uniref:uncharacterized protein n=1 Tax=Zychaea mexicana TaxID=64656 RepID=UPI0022FDCE78|nr:uncharacterized protein BDB00DRAFT_840174 [Zychaea mexicana]KAI9489945.1 hypothetical protein BDB00DRAFT_840174 [Zychaea mexicana]
MMATRCVHTTYTPFHCDFDQEPSLLQQNALLCHFLHHDLHRIKIILNEVIA